MQTSFWMYCNTDSMMQTTYITYLQLPFTEYKIINLSLSGDYESYLTNDIIKTWTQTTARNNGCPNL